MKTIGYGFSTLILLSLVSLPGCGVGTYHIPTVDPVVMPEPEEDIFADIEPSGAVEEEPSDSEESEESPKTEPAPESEPEAEPADPLE